MSYVALCQNLCQNHLNLFHVQCSIIVIIIMCLMTREPPIFIFPTIFPRYYYYCPIILYSCVVKQTFLFDLLIHATIQLDVRTNKRHLVCHINIIIRHIFMNEFSQWNLVNTVDHLWKFGREELPCATKNDYRVIRFYRYFIKWWLANPLLHDSNAQISWFTF